MHCGEWWEVRNVRFVQHIKHSWGICVFSLFVDRELCEIDTVNIFIWLNKGKDKDLKNSEYY